MNRNYENCLITLYFNSKVYKFQITHVLALFFLLHRYLYIYKYSVCLEVCLDYDKFDIRKSLFK